jgi:hypothetical protein
VLGNFLRDVAKLNQDQRNFSQSPAELKEEIMKYTIVMLGIILITDVGTCLGVDQTICTPGEIHYHPNGQLKSCILKDDFAINGVKCKQYAPISLYKTGKLKACVTSDYFNYGSITCNQYGEVSFYPSGKLNTCDLSKTIQIDGKTCAQFESISLLENGKLKSCSTPR